MAEFITRWKGSAGNERANKDSFLRDLCEAMELPRRPPFVITCGVGFNFFA